MKIKRLVLSIMCLVSLFGLTGCGNKTEITTDQFKSKVESNGLLTTDVTTQYSEYEYVKEATVALKEGEYQIEFYVLDNEANATSMFNTNKTIFETYKGNASKETSSSVGNYSKYTLQSNDLYMYLCRVKNTLLYIKVDDKYKDDVKNIVKDLGY